jgi:AraC family transcriptional regulator, regulatory protein of adaptative response / methylated-DNA-[protein]-cysteine methyltransferase
MCGSGYFGLMMSVTEGMGMTAKAVCEYKQDSEANPDDRRWLAVLVRDRSSDGKFVYAVRSTGIYCRPSCPSRRPKREQVRFYALPDAAERAGYRACKRCQPWTIELRNPLARVVAGVCKEIEKQILSEAGDGSASSLKLTTLSAGARLSPHQLQRAFRSLMGITPRQYADAQRMKRLKSQLRKGDDVTTALYDAGFGSSSRLYERAPSQLGMTPATYRQGGAGMEIQYTVANTPLGRMLVGATSRGISALYLGDSDSMLESALKKEYPHARLRKGRNGLEDWVRKIVSHLNGQEPDLDLPTDVKATAFQRRVWEELRRIPYGTTKTYGEVARSMGRPQAVRAVARACATNPTSVVVPCHRVIRKGGNLAGYRWGLDRKRTLLEMERKRRQSH